MVHSGVRAVLRRVQLLVVVVLVLVVVLVVVLVRVRELRLPLLPHLLLRKRRRLLVVRFQPVDTIIG